MSWNHLPVEGGLYNQHPVLLDRFMHIFYEKNQQEKREHEKKEAAMGGPGARKKPGRTSRPTR